MDLAPALAVGLGLPAVALLVGLVWRARDGRLRHVRRPADAAVPPDAAAPPTEASRLALGPERIGSEATLVQFSTEYCSRCPATARALGELAAEYADVRHIDIDLTNRPDLAADFRVTQTPTVLVLAADGRSTARVAGAPRIDELRDELDTITGRSRVRHSA